MKRIISLFAATLLVCNMSFAKESKRPESYNYQRGIEAVQQEKMGEALEYFNKDIQENPKSAGHRYSIFACTYIFIHIHCLLNIWIYRWMGNETRITRYTRRMSLGMLYIYWYSAHHCIHFSLLCLRKEKNLGKNTEIPPYRKYHYFYINIHTCAK